MAVCRTIAEVEAAADEDSKNDPPLSQAQADLLAAILARHPEMQDASHDQPRQDTADAYRNAELGHRRLSPGKLALVAARLGRDPSELLAGTVSAA